MWNNTYVNFHWKNAVNPRNNMKIIYEHAEVDTGPC